jgi:hypothetical protein
MNGKIVQTSEQTKMKIMRALLQQVSAEEIENLRTCREYGAYNVTAEETIDYVLELLDQSNEGDLIQLSLF